MQLTLTTRDTLAPDLVRRFRALSPERRRAAMEAIGLGLVSMAKRAFNTDPALRPALWAPKKDGTPSTLQKSTKLRNSIRITSVSAAGVTIGSDAKYAAIHQLGGHTKPHIIRGKFKKAVVIPGLGIFRLVHHPGSHIPARPYLPFFANGQPTDKADRLIKSVITAKLGLT